MTNTDRKPACDTEAITDRATANLDRALRRAVVDAFSGKIKAPAEIPKDERDAD